MQDGSEQDSNCGAEFEGSCSKGNNTYYLWLELFPQENQEEITNLSIVPGNAVEAAGQYFDNGGTYETYFLLCNNTQNTCVQAYQTPDGGPSNVAEWIVERTTVNDKLPPLTKYGTATLSQDSYSTGSDATNYPMADSSPNPITMENGNDILSTPGAISGGNSFATTWENFS